LDPGGFGAITITKAITIDGSNGNIAGVLVSGTNGITVAAGPNDVVVLRNLDIDGLGTGLNGIGYTSGAALHVENTRIYGFTQQGIDIAPTAGANAIYVSNTKLFSNAGGAIYAEPGSSASANVTLTDVIMDGNLRGLRTTGGVTSVVRNTVVTGSTGVGFNAGSTDSRTASMNLDSSAAISNVGWGVYAGVNATVYISNMQVTGNGGGITAVSGSMISFGNNHVVGNTTNGTPTQTIGSL
jgi:hypothetical protein